MQLFIQTTKEKHISYKNYKSIPLCQYKLKTKAKKLTT